MKRRVKSIDQKLKNRVAKNRHHRRRLQNLDRRKNAKRDVPENQRRNLATHLRRRELRQRRDTQRAKNEAAIRLEGRFVDNRGSERRPVRRATGRVTPET